MIMKLFLKPASGGQYNHNYKPITIGSIDFSDLVCSRCIESVPGDHFSKIEGNGLVRLAPQVFPPFGSLYFKSAAFFVPEHQIFSQSEAFHNNQTVYKGRNVKFPHILQYDSMNGYFASSSNLSTVINTLISTTSGLSPSTDYPIPSAYDFIEIVSENSGTDIRYNFRKLTRLGRKHYKIMKSLGYDFVTPGFEFFYGTVPSGYTNRWAWCLRSTNHKRSALPLLAFAKIYADYFISGQHFNNSNLAYFLQCVHDVTDCIISGQSWFAEFDGLVHTDGVKAILNYCSKVPVVQDLYSSAWNSPNSPTGVSISDYAYGNNSIGSVISPYLNPSNYTNAQMENSVSNGVYSRTSNISQIYNITSFGLRIQEAFFNFVMRNNLVGTRPVQRILSRFGITPSDATSHFVHKLFESSQEVDFHPVLSNADTVNAANGLPLGSYAGFGQSPLNFNFNYKATDFGFIIVVHWLQIKPILIHGTDPSVLRLNPFDWFTPEYDGQALRAIPYCEVSVLKDERLASVVSSEPRADDDIYGFTNIYDEYRYMRDSVIGDFVDGYTKNFMFGRDLSELRGGQDYTLKPQADDVQYGMIGFSDPFQMSSSIADRFWFSLRFDIDAQRPVKSESDALMLNGSGSIETSKNGTYSN